MNPTDLGNALLFGAPVALYAQLCGFDALLARRERLEPIHGSRPAVQVAIAKSSEQLEAAHNLVRSRYEWRGYQVLGEDPAIASRDRPGSQITFLATSGATAVGTLTLGLDGPHGLRAETAYSDIIDKFRAAGSRVCELTRLALAEGVDSKPVLASLFGLAHAVGRTLHQVTDVFIEVNPRHVNFYSRILGFAAAAGERFCERVRAPSVLLQLEIEALERRLKTLDVASLMQPLVVRAA